MTNEKGEKYGALLDSSIPDRTPLYAAQWVNTVTNIHHDPSWQEGYKEGYDDAEIVSKAGGVANIAPSVLTKDSLHRMIRDAGFVEGDHPAGWKRLIVALLQANGATK